jgi:phosphoglycolate phosphatase
MKKAIIFDLDGTILDTIYDIHQAVNIGLKKFNYPQVSIEQVKQSVGSGAKQMIALCAPDATSAEVQLIHDMYQAYYDDNHKDLTVIYEGMLSLLKELKQKYKLAVVSNKYHHLVQSLLNYYFKDLFDASLGMTQYIPIKPEPDMVIKMMQDLKVDVNEVIYVGDSEPDILVSKRLGLDHIAVSYGYRNETQLQKMKPMHLIKDVETLKYFLLSQV